MDEIQNFFKKKSFCYQWYVMDFYWFLREEKNQNPNFHEKDVSLANKYLFQENATSSSSLLHSLIQML